MYLEHCLPNNMDQQLLKQFVELLITAAQMFEEDKQFGKLLISILKSFGRKLENFTNQLQEIISSHKSIWKNQLHKVYSSICDDVQNMSQR